MFLVISPAYLRGSRCLPLCSYHTYTKNAYFKTSDAVPGEQPHTTGNPLTPVRKTSIGLFPTPPWVRSRYTSCTLVQANTEEFARVRLAQEGRVRGASQNIRTPVNRWTRLHTVEVAGSNSASPLRKVVFCRSNAKLWMETRVSIRDLVQQPLAVTCPPLAERGLKHLHLRAER